MYIQLVWSIVLQPPLRNGGLSIYDAGASSGSGENIQCSVAYLLHALPISLQPPLWNGGLSICTTGASTNKWLVSVYGVVAYILHALAISFHPPLWNDGLSICAAEVSTKNG